MVCKTGYFLHWLCFPQFQCPLATYGDCSVTVRQKGGRSSAHHQLSSWQAGLPREPGGQQHITNYSDTLHFKGLLCQGPPPLSQDAAFDVHMF